MNSDDDTCPCCLGDPDTVCDACGQHSCWAGIYMCWESATAGTCTAAEYAQRNQAAENPKP